MNIRKVHFDRNAGQHHAAHEERGVSRRDVLGALLAATTLAAVWTAPAAAQALKAAGAPVAANTAQALNATELATLTAAAESIMHATDTPGAAEAGVAQFRIDPAYAIVDNGGTDADPAAIDVGQPGDES